MASRLALAYAFSVNLRSVGASSLISGIDSSRNQAGSQQSNDIYWPFLHVGQSNFV